ncbi:hypothetical protein ACQPZA_01800 [Pseudonocardia xinjiangensis]|uniref:hypothetical protein n=1 Tax=Pseudonocardia xinjiangensis TaxID=75289 RepID=UPI003D8AD363
MVFPIRAPVCMPAHGCAVCTAWWKQQRAALRVQGVFPVSLGSACGNGAACEK